MSIIHLLSLKLYKILMVAEEPLNSTLTGAKRVAFREQQKDIRSAHWTIYVFLVWYKVYFEEAIA